MPVFLTVLVLNPTDKQKFDDGTVAQILGGVNAVIADSETSAAAKAMRFLPDEMKDKQDRVEVAVLPFRRATA